MITAEEEENQAENPDHLAHPVQIPATDIVEENTSLDTAEEDLTVQT